MGAVAKFTRALQNSDTMHLSYYKDNALYNKLKTDITNGGGHKVIDGDLNDLKQYLGSSFFSIPVDYVNFGGTISDESIVVKNAFNSYEHDRWSSSGTVLDTSGLFECDYYSTPHIGIINYGGGAYIGSNPLYGNRMATINPVGAEFDYFGLLGDLFLDGAAIEIRIGYKTYFHPNGWFMDAFFVSGGNTWNYVIDAWCGSKAQAVKNFITNTEPDIYDPYEGGGNSGEGGGNGNFSENSDGVNEDAMPDETNYSAIACGLVTIFNPTKAQLKKLADVILGNGFWNFVQNMVENISDLFVSLGMVPFTITPGSAVEVTWWGYTGGGLEPGTGVYLNLASHQYYEFDMGSINLATDARIFSSGSVLDYSPFSKLGIYLPFIGYQELDIDECRGQIIKLKYRIDILSGTCVAIITLNNDGIDRAIYQFTGNCLTQIPLTSVDASSMITNAVNIGVAAFSAGATQAVASAGDALTAENLADPKSHLTATGAELQNKQHAASVSNASGSLASSTVGGVMGMKPNYKHSGAVSSSASLFGVKQPYLFLTTPRQSYPANYSHYCGFPCNITDTLGNFSGYTVVEDIRLNGLVATSSEVEEIYALLKSGVII